MLGLFKKKKQDDNANYLVNIKKQGIIISNFELETGLIVDCYEPVLDNNYKLVGYEKNSAVVKSYNTSKNESISESQYIKYISGELIVTKTVSVVRWLEDYDLGSKWEIHKNTKVYATSNYYLLEKTNSRRPVYYLVKKRNSDILKTDVKTREERRQELYLKNKK